MYGLYTYCTYGGGKHESSLLCKGCTVHTGCTCTLGLFKVCLWFLKVCSGVVKGLFKVCVRFVYGLFKVCLRFVKSLFKGCLRFV